MANCQPWPVAPHCLPQGWEPCRSKWDRHQRDAVDAATEILNRLTAGVFGLCCYKIRPCRRRCNDRDTSPFRYALGGVSGPWQPMLLDGQLYNIQCGCQGECGCSPLCEIVLPNRVHDITEVKVDGTVLPNFAYRVDDYRRLVRIDGQCWPDCQELQKPDTEKGTFSVTYRTGVPVPAGGRIAVTELAVQWWKACGGAKGCVLSDRVTQVVREGITYTLDNLDIFERGRTGINRVDLWLATVNPYGARLPMRAYSPDTIRARRTTWKGQTMSCRSYVHTQSIPSAVWTIQHNLGSCPASVHVQQADGTDLLGGDIECSPANPNLTTITYATPYAGTAVLLSTGAPSTQNGGNCGNCGNCGGGCRCYCSCC